VVGDNGVNVVGSETQAVTIQMARQDFGASRKSIITFWSRLSCTNHAYISLIEHLKPFLETEVALHKPYQIRSRHHVFQSPACEKCGRRKEWASTRSSKPDVSHSRSSTEACVDLIVSISRTFPRRSIKKTSKERSICSSQPTAQFSTS
jgi:hypothetical protein